MKDSIKILNTEYKLIQTTYSNYQGVWIIYKENLNINFEYSDNNTGWVLVSSIRENKKIVAYIIGIYRRTENKKEITEEVSGIIKGLGENRSIIISSYSETWM